MKQSDPNRHLLALHQFGVKKPKKIAEFQAVVWAYYRACGRTDLPWRKTRDPYKILVSEVMLQQTQCERVRVKYLEFLKTYPTVKALSQSSIQEVLTIWSGLG